jgi:hypothetical protein
VPPPGAEPGEVNVHAAWRMAVAERAPRAYAVVLSADTSPVKHMRLAALQRSRPLLGAELITSWRARADTFPGELVAVLVQQTLDPEVRHHLITGLEVVPERLAGRLESMSASPAAEAFRAAEALLEDTVLLAEAHTGADLSSFRHALAQRRRPLDPPRAGR